MASLFGYISDTELFYEETGEIPIDESTPCCGDRVDGPTGGTTPGDVLGEDPFQPLPAWIRNCAGGGTVPSAADPADSEDWSV